MTIFSSVSEHVAAISLMLFLLFYCCKFTKTFNSSSSC